MLLEILECGRLRNVEAASLTGVAARIRDVNEAPSLSDRVHIGMGGLTRWHDDLSAPSGSVHPY
jgi:hypothetical protein